MQVHLAQLTAELAHAAGWADTEARLVRLLPLRAVTCVFVANKLINSCNFIQLRHVRQLLDAAQHPATNVQVSRVCSL